MKKQWNIGRSLTFFTYVTKTKNRNAHHIFIYLQPQFQKDRLKQLWQRCHQQLTLLLTKVDQQLLGQAPAPKLFSAEIWKDNWCAKGFAQLKRDYEAGMDYCKQQFISKTSTS